MNRHDRIDPARLIGVRVGARDLLKVEPTMGEVQRRLEHYSLPQVLAMLGRVGAVFRDKSTSAHETQEVLAHAFFPPAQLAALRTRAQLAARRDGGGDRAESYAMFDPHVAKALAIFAGATMPIEREDTEASPVFLGEALLILNDLYEQGVEPPALDGAVTPDPEWVYYFAVAAYRFGVEPTVTAIVRAVELFLDPATNEGERGRPDLASVFNDVTGLDLGAYVLICIAVIGKMLEVDSSNVHEQTPMLSRNYLDGFDERTREQFHELTGLSIDLYCERAKEAWPEGATRPRHWLPIETSPFIWTGEVGICISIEELERRLTVGLYHTLLNAKRKDGSNDRKFSAAVQREVGLRFQAYVERSFERMERALSARGSWHPRERRPPGPVFLIRDEELVSAVQRGAKNTPSTCDVALLVGSDLLLVEVKGKFFDLEARTGRSQLRFLTRLKEIVIDGADQLNETVKYLRDGALAGIGLTTRRVRRVLPIIVSLDPVPLSPPLRKWIDHELERERLLQAEPSDPVELLPLEILSARDVEWLETIVESTSHQPGNVLADKVSSEVGRAVSLVSWSAINQFPSPLPSRPYPRHHEERWEELTENAASFFRSTRRSGESPRVSGDSDS
ncbi:MAG: hypothetical protein ACK5XT_03370 [Gemmatimonas sp.]|uniref:hypothetical protein n=1 Tax=Gemmatimonas sp. TaxID=1962908 RepID=UPI00391F0E4C|nr:hypothetical protein [Gemmatimonadota bacterium]